MSYTKKVALNTAAQFVGKIVGIAISLATIGLLFRFLGVEGAGKYTTAFAYSSFFSLFADIGLGWTLLRELATKKTKEEKSKAFKNIFTLRLVIGIFVFTSASSIVWLLHYPPDVKMAVVILSIAWLFQSLTSSVVQIYLNFYRMDIAVLAEIIGKACILLVVYGVSRAGGTLVGVMFAYLVGNFVNFAIVFLMGAKFIETGLAFDKKYWRFAMRQALPIGLTLVFGYVYYKVDSLMLSFLKGMTDVGIYGAPYRLLEVLQIIPAIFLGSSFSLITRYATDKDDRLNSAFQKQFNFLSLLAMPIVVGTFVLALPIIRFVTGSGGEFTTTSTVSIFGRSMTSVACLKILIFSVGVNFFSTLYNFMIVSLGKQRQMIWPTIGFAAFNLVLNFILIPRYSYIGASISTVLTEIIVLVVTYLITKKSIVLALRFDQFFKTMFASLLMGVATKLAYGYTHNLFISIFAALIVYSILVLSMKVVPIDMLKKGLKRA